MEKERVIISDIKAKYDINKDEDVLIIYQLIQSQGYRFETREGIAFDDDIFEKAQRIKREGIKNKTSEKQKIKLDNFDKDLQIEIKKQMRVMDGKHKVLLMMCLSIAVACIGYFVFYYYMSGVNNIKSEEIASLVENTIAGQKSDISNQEIYVDDAGKEQTVILQVLQKYKTIYNSNENLIGWIKIDDTNIDYPVMQCDDSEHYLSYNFYEEYDKNGCLFMDPECSIVNRSDNLILYGHHMKSGNMFGNLDLYSDYDYYLKHKYIQFDTIYEEGTYEVMYVFRSKIYTEDEIRFKYYQFINANSAEEFDSYMREMSEMSLYDTKVIAGFGDSLITLSTCDYQETNGRFVVVAKKIQ